LKLVSKRVAPNARPSAKPRIPAWALAVVFLASLYFFWILPRQMPKRPIRIDFVPSPSLP
jgi:hypothetical protein